MDSCGGVNLCVEITTHGYIRHYGSIATSIGKGKLPTLTFFVSCTLGILAPKFGQNLQMRDREASSPSSLLPLTYWMSRGNHCTESPSLWILRYCTESLRVARGQANEAADRNVAWERGRL